MSKITRLAALKSGCDLSFMSNMNPKCPHCGADYDIDRHEAWELYEDGQHEIECPSCEIEFAVMVDVSYAFSTDDQEEEGEA